MPGRTPEWELQAFGRFLLTADAGRTLAVRAALNAAMASVHTSDPAERLERIWAVLDGLGVREWGERHLVHMWRDQQIQERLPKGRHNGRTTTT